MNTLYRLASLDYIVLYKRTSPLSKGLTFVRYLKILDELDFSPYRFEIEEVPLVGYYTLEMLPDPPMLLPYTPLKPFLDIMFLNRAKISYSKKQRKVLLEAGASAGRILQFLLMLTMVLIMLIVSIAEILLVPLLIAVLILVLLVSAYYRDIQRYEKMQSIALHFSKGN
jgi:hypothetical protein